MQSKNLFSRTLRTNQNFITATAGCTLLSLTQTRWATSASLTALIRTSTSAWTVRLTEASAATTMKIAQGPPSAPMTTRRHLSYLSTWAALTRKPAAPRTSTWIIMVNRLKELLTSGTIDLSRTMSVRTLCTPHPRWNETTSWKSKLPTLKTLWFT